MPRFDAHNYGTTTSGAPFDPGQAIAAMQGSAAMRGAIGSLRGEQVFVSNKGAASLLDDAKEELTMAHSEKVEGKSIEERQLEIDGPIDLKTLREIQSYLRSAGKLDDQAKLEQLVKHLLQGRADPRELVRQQSREPATQFMLLQLALHEANENGEPREVIERLQDALADLEMEAGPRIRAGLNSVAVASELGATSEAREAFQATYSDVVLGRPTLAQTLLMVLERLGGVAGREFEAGLQGLIRALGADMSAARPSTDMERLRALVQDLYHLEVAGTVLQQCRTLGERMGERFGVGTLDAAELMKELVTLTGERWLSLMRFQDLAQRFRLSELVERIFFFTATVEMLRTMPVQVYTDSDARRAVLDANQEALDMVIRQEEEREGDDEDGGGDSDGNDEDSEDDRQLASDGSQLSIRTLMGDTKYGPRGEVLR